MVKASMKKYSKMKTRLMGGTAIILVASTLTSYIMLNNTKVDIAKSKTEEFSRTIQTSVISHESDISKFIMVASDSALQQGYNYSLILSNSWGKNLTNDDLLTLSKHYNFSAMTLYNISKEGVVGTHSTQPNRIGYTLNNTETEKEILEFLLSHKNGGDIALSDSLRTFSSSIITEPYKVNNDYYFDVYTYIADTSQVLAITLPYAEISTFFATQSTNNLIETMKAQYPQIVEIGILDISTITKDTEATILSGDFKYATTGDNKILTNPKSLKDGYIYLQDVNGKQLFKNFTPIDDKRVLYIGLDYSVYLESTKSSASAVAGASGVAIILIALLMYFHFRKEQVYHDMVLKRLNTLASGKYKLKELERNKDEYHNILLYLDTLTKELATTKKNVSDIISDLRRIHDLITSGEVEDAKDLEDLRVEIKSIMSDLELAIKLESI